MDWTGCEYVECVDGVTVVRGSKVNSETVVMCFKAGDDVQDIALGHNLSYHDVSGVLWFYLKQLRGSVSYPEVGDVQPPPIDWTSCDYVEQVPGRMGGVPVVRDSRVTADCLVVGIMMGETAMELAYNFSLRLPEVRGVLAYAESWQPLAKAG